MRRLTQLALGAAGSSRARNASAVSSAERGKRPTFAEDGWATAPSVSLKREDAEGRNRNDNEQTLSWNSSEDEELHQHSRRRHAEAAGSTPDDGDRLGLFDVSSGDDGEEPEVEEEQPRSLAEEAEAAFSFEDAAGANPLADAGEPAQYFYSADGDEEDAFFPEHDAYELDADGAEEEQVFGGEEAVEEEEAELQPEDLQDGAADADGSQGESLKPFSRREIERRVQVRTVEGKGRCLYTRGPRKPGEIIFVEQPLLVAVPALNAPLWELLTRLHEEQPLELPPIWHLAALCSLTEMEEDALAACLEKWVPDPEQEAGADVLRVLEFIDGEVDPALYERLLQVWRFNSFGHHSEKDGLVLYDRISMMAHSCRASASWHYGEGEAFVLRARVQLEAGAEITISYIGDEELFKSTNVRREKVRGWLFVCHCLRCDAPVDNCRGFRCPSCGSGTTFFKETLYDDESQSVEASPCNVCGVTAPAETVAEYVSFEAAYIERLADTNKESLADAEEVYEQATRLFTQHWVLYQLDTILFEGYRAQADYDAALNHQRNRIQYATQVMPQATYSLAWLYEELGDLLASRIESGISSSSLKRRCSRNYEDAYNLLYILCGPDHEYTAAPLQKLERLGLKDEAEGGGSAETEAES